MRRLWRSFLPALVLIGVVLAAPSSTAQTPTPSVTYTITNEQGNVLRPRNTWYRQKVVLRWKVEPEATDTDCLPAILIAVQTAGRTFSCTAEWPGTTIIRKTVPPIRIDWTPPTEVKVRRGRPPDAYGWYGHQVNFFFSGRDALSRIDRCPTKIYRRPNDATASVTGFCQDRAGNVTKRTVNFKYRRPLLSPPGGHKTWRPPLLDWIDVKNARFYNIQLWHDGKVLSKFRDGSRFQVPGTWWQDGVRRSLEPGAYTVYVWPRFSGRYGREALRTWFVKR
jgi:hypothetical protein